MFGLGLFNHTQLEERLWALEPGSTLMFRAFVAVHGRAKNRIQPLKLKASSFRFLEKSSLACAVDEEVGYNTESKQTIIRHLR